MGKIQQFISMRMATGFRCEIYESGNEEEASEIQANANPYFEKCIIRNSKNRGILCTNGVGKDDLFLVKLVAIKEKQKRLLSIVVYIWF